MNKMIAIGSALTLLLSMGCASTSEPPPAPRRMACDRGLGL